MHVYVVLVLNGKLLYTVGMLAPIGAVTIIGFRRYTQDYSINILLFYLELSILSTIFTTLWPYNIIKISRGQISAVRSHDPH